MTLRSNFQFEGRCYISAVHVIWLWFCISGHLMVRMVNNILEAQCRSSLLTYQATSYKVIGWDKWEEEDVKYSLYLLLKLA